MDVVEAEAALDAQPVLVGGSAAPIDVEDLVTLGMHRGLATDAAVGAERVDAPVFEGNALLRRLVEQRRLHQRTGRAHLHALAARHARRLPHALVEVEHDLRPRAAVGHADHVVRLHLAAGAHAQAAVDAGIEIDRDGRVRGVAGGPLAARIAAGLGDAHVVDPGPELGLRIVGITARGLIGDEQLEHHLLRFLRPLGRRLHLHAGSGLALAGRGQHALALDLDDAGAAVAVGAIAGRRMPAQMRDRRAVALRHLPDGLAGLGLDLAAIEREGDLAHGHLLP